VQEPGRTLYRYFYLKLTDIIIHFKTGNPKQSLFRVLSGYKFIYFSRFSHSLFVALKTISTSFISGTVVWKTTEKKKLSFVTEHTVMLEIFINDKILVFYTG
jgi:hypothetical protein